MKLVILTGMSGAGKSTALKMMEDIGFYCVDNLPIPLIEKFIELADLRNTELQKVAVGVDIRSGQALGELRDVLDRIQKRGVSYQILFLDAEDSVLVKRYKETRRNHPLSGGERVDKGIEEERKRLVGLLKALPLTITGTTGYNEAVVTCGGIQVNEIDPATMESKFVKQLHFAGEVLDVDAYTGGFNLQIAFSTGFAAGNAVCAE